MKMAKLKYVLFGLAAVAAVGAGVWFFFFREEDEVTTASKAIEKASKPEKAIPMKAEA